LQFFGPNRPFFVLRKVLEKKRVPDEGSIYSMKGVVQYRNPKANMRKEKGNSGNKGKR
jgi:hypothetical protein